jgi:hypothetical protein
LKAYLTIQDFSQKIYNESRSLSRAPMIASEGTEGPVTFRQWS